MLQKDLCAVLIHGYHLEAVGWESVVWGDLKNNTWGSIPRGIEYAWRTQAEIIVWGTGASEIDGKKEAEVMYERAIEGIDELAFICDVKPELLKEFIKERSIIDTKSTDTKSEIQETFNICLNREIKKVALVPVASQAPLAIRRALWLVIEHEEYNSFKHSISIIPSDTSHPGSSMQDIVIFTPPHRGDRVDNPSHLFARKTLDILQGLSKAGDIGGIEKFLTEWDSILEKYNNKKDTL